MTEPTDPTPDLETTFREIVTEAREVGGLTNLQWPDEDLHPHFFNVLLGQFKAWCETPEGRRMDPGLHEHLLEAFEAGVRAENAMDRPAARRVNEILARSKPEPLSATVYGADVMAQATAAQMLNSGRINAGEPPSAKDIDLMFGAWVGSEASDAMLDDAAWKMARRAYEAGMDQSRFILAERLAFLDAVTHYRPIQPTVTQRTARAVLGFRGRVAGGGSERFRSWAEPASFAAKVVDLAFKCDVFNRRLLRRVFPEYVDAVNLYETDHRALEQIAEAP